MKKKILVGLITAGALLTLAWPVVHHLAALVLLTKLCQEKLSLEVQQLFNH